MATIATMERSTTIIFLDYPLSLPNCRYLNPPPPPGADTDVDPDPNAPWDNMLMCTNTPTKRSSSSQVWCLEGKMHRLAPKHPKWCDKYYNHICVVPLEGAYEGLV